MRSRDPSGTSSAPDYCIVVPVLDQAEALPSSWRSCVASAFWTHALRGQWLHGRRSGARPGGRRGAAARAAPRLRLSAPDGRPRPRPRAPAVGFMEADGTDDPARPGTSLGRRWRRRPPGDRSRRRAVQAPRPVACHSSAARPPGWRSTCAHLRPAPQRRRPLPRRRTDLVRSCVWRSARPFPTEMAVKARLAGARIAIRGTRYRQRAGASKIAGTWRGSALAVRDIFWCLLRLGLFGFRPGSPARPFSRPAAAGVGSCAPGLRRRPASGPPARG